MFEGVLVRVMNVQTNHTIPDCPHDYGEFQVSDDLRVDDMSLEGTPPILGEGLGFPSVDSDARGERVTSEPGGRVEVINVAVDARTCSRYAPAAWLEALADAIGDPVRPRLTFLPPLLCNVAALRIAVGIGSWLDRPVDRPTLKVAIGVSKYFFRSVSDMRVGMPWFTPDFSG